ncbi:MAG: hypothetical protein OXE42_07510 [Gammaproteobacteria bacterium]|nr:hypothetical protein [Gammaproteobacteria bacterium]
MAKFRVLITVTTYPLPSRSYDELVCTAGVLEDGSLIRIYPVPFHFLEYHKWEWVELELIKHKHTHDFRPESYRPKRHDLSDLVVVQKIGTEQAWYVRKQACLKNVYTNLTTLIHDSKDPKNVSLATFKPKRLIKFIVEDDEREWKEQWLEQLKQVNLFTGGANATEGPRVPVDKIPYKFKYQFEDEAGKVSTMAIEDWEIGALFRNCLAAAEGDEVIAVEKVREKYEKDFMQNKDIALFLGTTLKHHRARHTNPFTIVGVFYPPRQPQQQLL